MEAESTNLTGRKVWLLIAGVILAGVLIRLWAASQWRINFDSDEAIFGLMGLHFTKGDFPATVYGTEHLGSIESLLASPFLAVFGPNVLALRAPVLLLFALFLFLHAIYVKRSWGNTVTIISLLLLITPGFHILIWTYQPIGAYVAMLVLGTALLIAGQFIPQTKTQIFLQLLLSGIIVGLGLWSNQMFIVYLGAISIVVFLRSVEWKVLEGRLRDLFETRIKLPLHELLLLLIITMGVLFTLAFFSNACEPRWQFSQVKNVSRILLLLSLLLIGSSLLIISQRRTILFYSALLLGAGAILGYSPLFIEWIVEGTRPLSVIRPSCPSGVFSRGLFVFRDMFPATFGIPGLQELFEMAPVGIVLWTIVLGLAVSAVIYFIWRYRTTLWKIVSLRVLANKEPEIGLVALLFWLPLMLSVLGSNTVDIFSVRHLIITWQAGAIIFAIFLRNLISKRRLLGYGIALVWIMVVGVSNLIYANNNWLVKFTTYEPENVSKLTEILNEKDVTSGYADFWGAYTLDFLTNEQLTIAPYNGIDRYPKYTRDVLDSPTFFVILPADWVSSRDRNSVTLIDFLEQENLVSGEGPAREDVVQQIQEAELDDALRVEAWDVWVFVRD
jgi:hypothetical protein